MKFTQQNSEEVELGRPQDSPASRLALWLPWVPAAYHCPVTPLKDRAELGTEWKVWRSHPSGECPYLACLLGGKADGIFGSNNQNRSNGAVWQD